MSLKREIWNYFIVRFFTISLVCGVLYALYIYVSVAKQRNVERRHNAQLISTLSSAIQSELNYISKDLEQILHSQEMQQFIEDQSQATESSLAYYFSVFTEVSRRYDQIRILSTKGMEQIRVNYIDNSPVIVPADKLQNKSDRYYHKELLKLPKNVSYVSTLDLNEEQGKVETPHKPAIRVSHKIYDRYGQFVGVLVLNYLGQAVIDQLSIASRLSSKLSLIDGNGHWIFDEDGRWNWSNQLHHKTKVSDLNQTLWQQLLNSQTSNDSVIHMRLNYPIPINDVEVPNPRTLYLVAELPTTPFIPILLRETAKPLPLFTVLVVAFLSFVWSQSTSNEQRAIATIKIESERAKQILHTSLVAIVVFDQNGAITDFNTSAEELFGFSAEEVLCQNIQKLLPKNNFEHDSHLENTLKTQVVSGLGQSQRVSGIHKNGQLFPVELSITQTTSAGNSMFIGNLRDLRTEDALLAEQKHLAVQEEITLRLEKAVEQRTFELEVANQELTQQRDRAESATKAKTEFLANMSHEIRTPLNAILGMAQILKRSEVSADIHRVVENMTLAGNSLLSVINDILDVSRLSARKMSLEPAEFKLPKLLQSVATIMHTSSGTKPVEMVIQQDFKLDYTIVGDESRLNQVLINLVGNAIKFTESGYVRLEVLKLSESKNTVELEFRVKDSGIGISSERHGSILDAFEQGSVDIHTKFGGTGLGLAISQAILQLMGSELIIFSKLGEGSTFSFKINLQIGQKIEPIERSDSGLSVLVADDQEIARDAIGSIVNALGWRPKFASNGQQAICKALSDESKLDVVLLDWDMSDIDGLTAAKTIKATNISKPAPIVIMVTASGLEKVRASDNSDYVDYILQKPITSSQLFDAFMEVQKHTKGFQQKPVSSSKPKLKGTRILVADDNEFNREVVVSLFEQEGANIHAVCDGQEAVEYLREHHGSVDVVLMDVQMPRLNGHQATHVIRQELELKTPIVALTAGAFDHQRDAAIQAGMNDFLPKPFNIEDAVELIVQLLGKSNHKDKPAVQFNESADQSKFFNQTEAKEYWPKAQKLEKFLRLFKSEYGPVIDAIKGTDAVEARQWIHRLKGTTVFLGMKPLTSCADSILKNSETLLDEIPEAELQRLTEVFRSTVHEVDQFLVSYSGKKTLKQSEAVG